MDASLPIDSKKFKILHNMASLEHVLRLFKELNHIVLATVEGDKPRMNDYISQGNGVAL